MKNFIKVMLVVIAMVTIQLSVFADVPYKVDVQNSSVIITGTSTLHDWEMDVEDFSGNVNLPAENTYDQLTSGGFTLNVESIKSEHSLMNKKTYEALKEDDFPQITAKLVKADSGNAQIELTIAGKTKTISDDYQLKDLDNGKFQVTGELDIKLSDFDVEPPVALMGTIKTGNDVKVKYNLVYQK